MSAALPELERLEFLGDSILGAIVAAELFRAFPQASEGELSMRKSSVVNNRRLAEEARRCGLAGAGDTQRVAARAFEAHVGRAYLQQGQEAAAQLVRPLVKDSTISLSAKAALNDLLGGRVHKYDMLKCEGPQHALRFEMGLWVEERLVARAWGTSKKRAEEEAAKIALSLLF